MSLALLKVLSVIVGTLFGLRAVLYFALFMVLQTLFTTFHAQRLWRLLEAPVYGEVPGAPGVWGELITGCLRSAGTLRCAGASSSTRGLFEVLNVWKACRKPTTANPCLLELNAENPKISAMAVAPVESWPVACCHNPPHNGSPFDRV